MSGPARGARIRVVRSFVAILIAGSLACWPGRPLAAQDHEHHTPLARVPDHAGAHYAKGTGSAQQYQLYQNAKRPSVAVDQMSAKALLEATTEIFQASLAKSNVKAVGDQAVRVGEKWFVHYDLKYGDIPITDRASVMAIVDRQGTAVATRRRNVPTVVDGVEPTVSKEVALALARAESSKSFRLARLDASEPRLEIWVDDQQQGILSWRIRLQSPSPGNPYAREIWIAATGNARVLAQENLIYHAHRAQVRGTIWRESPLKETLPDQPFAEVELQLLENDEVRTTAKTNSQGDFVFPGFGRVKIKAVLKGPYCEIEDQTEGSNLLERVMEGDDTRPFLLSFDGDQEAQLAQATAFYWTNRAARFCDDIFADAAGTADHPLARLKTRVNIADSCNAYWDGSSINFFRSGGDCPNTAYSDVVIHEYGHGVDDRIGGIEDGGYSEGFGDALMILMIRQPCLGRDFLGEGKCLRDAREVITWPPKDPEVHYVGRIYAGFVWELVQQLQKNHSEDQAYAIAKRLVLSAAAGNPSDIPDAVKLSFLADDDDNDLANGSPYFQELAAAADSRGIPRPADPTQN